MPAAWHNNPDSQPVATDWLTGLSDPQLNNLVTEALENNHDLAAQATQVTLARQQLVISGAPRLPELTASATATERGTLSSSTASTPGNIDLSLNLNWEIDIWGKLKATQKQATLSLAAQETQLELARQNLTAEISNTWHDVLEAQELLSLYEHRLQNLNHNLDIIESGYRQGLTPALDVYLTRNGVQQEAARTSAQRQILIEHTRHLQLLLGRYPDGQLFPEQALPQPQEGIPAGLPSEIISRRPDLRRAWLELAAADVGVAITHKQRFPHLSITGRAGQSSTELKNLLDASQGIWSLTSSLLQPLFNAGQLAAREKEARARQAQLEQQYLSQVLQAFSEVEQALAQEDALKTQYQQYIEAEKSALAAEQLSFEQYQRGLVSYATVLESQRRAFDAQSAVVKLKRQRLYNRIALHLALGGNFEEQDR